MNKPVTHFFRTIIRKDSIKTTTLCGRMSDKTEDGINSTDDASKVTCKFCKKKIDTRETK